MNHKRIIAGFVSIFLFFITSVGQEVVTMEEILVLARKYSLDYRKSKIKFLENYWEYRKYRLELLPKISFNTTPLTVNRTITERYDFESNIDVFRQTSTISSNTGMSISQRIPFTGGNISLGSNISRIENFGESDFTSFGATPFRISFSQPLFEHNPYRWEKKELPLILKYAKVNLLQSEQGLYQEIIEVYFNYLKALQMFELAQREVKNSDTLYIAGKRLLELSRITPTQLTELKLKKTNAGIALANREQELNDAKYWLNKELRGHLPPEKSILLVDSVPALTLNTSRILDLCRALNPFYVEIEQERIRLQKNIDQAEKGNRFSANLSFSYGLNKGGETIREAFENPLSQQTGSVSISIPTFNWGINKGNLLLARKNLEMAELELETKIADFEQNIVKKVVENKINQIIVKSTRNAKELARKVYSVKLQQYQIGKVTLQELNQSQLELLNAKEKHIESITNFWTSFYELQKLTLYDLRKNKPLTTDFEKLMNFLN